ncbi:MarR family transcriptional regulator [Apilactobacillus apinorum]|uniref:HTH marR-type domain-containing protein n=1 Tax=Apilactobacillus apinorum TaxID=1218495 RepID=A0ABP9ZHS1_9LACO|nr:MarR family transcriptional regulator [Apilactobacillus apinorum]KOY69826.1 hypothetical protein RZ74_00930 [Apilactobacillus apinorum]CAI2611180.1 Hypothetical protein AAPFHON13_00990 [Apilactobacillus apinorum]
MIDLKNYDINQTQHRIIYSISELDIASMGNILRLLNISRQALNVNVRDLMSRNLIEEVSSDKDKRIKTLHLTTEGNKLNDQINAEQMQKIETLFTNVDNDWEKAMQQLANEYIKGFDK